jgi:hypothetical protein
MKNKHDGWSTRRRYKRKADQTARRLGYADHRSMCHARNVEELRGILKDLMLVPNAPTPENVDCKLFDTRAVAEAIGSSPKVVRHLVFTRQLESEPPRNENARRLFFRPSIIHKFLWSRGIAPGSELLKSATIAANPRGVGGIGMTKKEVARILQISTLRVEQYLAHGLLGESAVSSKRLTLITCESVDGLLTRLIDEEGRECERLMKPLAKHFARVAKDGRTSLMMDLLRLGDGRLRPT